MMEGEGMDTDIQFLKDLQQTMQWEDGNDCDSQASPRFWVIMDYREVPANNEYDDGFDSYFHNDGDHTEFRNFDDLKNFIEEYYEDEVNDYLQSLLNDESKHFDTLWAYVQNHLNDGGFFGECFVKEEDFIVQDTMFLTKEEAKHHLELNHYHYTSKAHTYAMTAWRAPKVKRLLNILMSFDWDFVQVNEAEEENKKLREALEKIMEVEAPITEVWETQAYKIARQALGGESHD